MTSIIKLPVHSTASSNRAIGIQMPSAGQEATKINAATRISLSPLDLQTLEQALAHGFTGSNTPRIVPHFSDNAADNTPRVTSATVLIGKQAQPFRLTRHFGGSYKLVPPGARAPIHAHSIAAVAAQLEIEALSG